MSKRTIITITLYLDLILLQKNTEEIQISVKKLLLMRRKRIFLLKDFVRKLEIEQNNFN